MKRFHYSSSRDRCGLLPWFDAQTRRWISRRTLIRRTGLSREHIISFENGRDGFGYRQTYAERLAAEDASGVMLF